MIKILFGVLLVLVCAAPLCAKELFWNANTEPDMKKYHVYMCKVKGCVVSDAGVFWVGEVLHVAGQIEYSFPIPAGIEGAAVATAEDTGGLVSLPSNVATFSTVLNIRPGAPSGLTSR